MPTSISTTGTKVGQKSFCIRKRLKTAVLVVIPVANIGCDLFQGVFAFSTNGNGAIDGWSMSLNGTVFGPGGYTSTANSVDFGGVGGDSALISTTCTAFFPLQRPQTLVVGRRGAIRHRVFGHHRPGRLRLDPASAASGLTLLLGGVAVLRGRRKLGS